LSARVVRARTEKSGPPIRIHDPGEPRGEIFGRFAKGGADREGVGEGRLGVDAVQGPGGKNRGDTGGQMSGPQRSGSPKVLSTGDRVAKVALGGVVVERDLGTVEEEGETVPVYQETLDSFDTRSREGVGVRILFRLALHKGEMCDEIGPVFDAIFRFFSETIEESDSRDPGGDPRLHPRDGDEGFDKIPSNMGPAEGERESDNPRSGIFVGRVAVDHEGADSL